MSDWGSYTPGPWRMRHKHVDCGPGDDERAGLGWDWDWEEQPDGRHKVLGPDEPQLRGLVSKYADARLISKAYLIPRLEGTLDVLQKQLLKRRYDFYDEGLVLEARTLLGELRQP